MPLLLDGEFDEEHYDSAMIHIVTGWVHEWSSERTPSEKTFFVPSSR